jgi:hypothetical protein
VYKISTGQVERSTTGQENVPIPSIKVVNTICAHDHSIGKIALGGISEKEKDSSTVTGRVFATASVKGTIIRVFSLTTCEKLHEFQRGSSPCTIHSLAFNSDVTILAVSGSKGTVHLFHLLQENRVQARSCSSHSSHANSTATTNNNNNNSVGGLYPYLKQWISGKNKRGNQQATENVVRSFARIRIKGEYANMPNVITMGTSTTINKTDDDDNVEENVVICPMDGTLIQYAVNHKGRKRPVRAEKFFTSNVL